MDVLPVSAPLAQHHEKVFVGNRQSPFHHDADVTWQPLFVVVNDDIADLGILRSSQFTITVLSENLDQVPRVHPGSPVCDDHPYTIIDRGDRPERRIGKGTPREFDSCSQGGRMPFRTQLIGNLPLSPRLQ